MPEVSRTTLGFSQMVTPLNFFFFAYSKAAVTIRRAAGRVIIRTLAARSGPGTLANALNLGCELSALRTISGGFVHSIPAYIPSLPWRKIVLSIFGYSKQPSVRLRM